VSRCWYWIRGNGLAYYSYEANRVTSAAIAASVAAANRNGGPVVPETERLPQITDGSRQIRRILDRVLFILWGATKIVIVLVVASHACFYICVFMAAGVAGAAQNALSQITGSGIAQFALAVAVAAPLAILVTFVTLGYVYRARRAWVVGLGTLAALSFALQAGYMAQLAATAKRSSQYPLELVDAGVLAFAGDMIWLSIILAPPAVLLGRVLRSAYTSRGTSVGVSGHR
jgi:hypothetical protein